MRYIGHNNSFDGPLEHGGLQPTEPLTVQCLPVVGILKPLDDGGVHPVVCQPSGHVKPLAVCPLGSSRNSRYTATLVLSIMVALSQLGVTP